MIYRERLVDVFDFQSDGHRFVSEVSNATALNLPAAIALVIVRLAAIVDHHRNDRIVLLQGEREKKKQKFLLSTCAFEGMH